MERHHFTGISGASLAAAYVFTSSRSGGWSTLVFLGSFIASWMVLFAGFALWAIQLYPKLFSPLRHLPEPSGNSFWNGQFARIQKEPSGVPMVDWINSVPNDGLIRYKGLLNHERLLLTTPKALAEVLTTRSYDFQKPAQFQTSIGRILGVGILLAEGEEHRVQRRNLMPAFAFRHIKDLYPVFWEKSAEAVQAMTDQVLLDAAIQSRLPPDNVDKAQPQSSGADGDATPKTAVMEVGGWASRATLDIIGVAGLGRDFGAINNPNSELIQTYTRLFKPSRQAQLLGLLGTFLPGWVITRIPVRRNDDIHAAAAVIRATCRDLIRSKKEKLLARNRRQQEGLGSQDEKTRDDHNDDDNDRTTAATGDVDILSVALESGGFSDENLVDQLMTFLAAGHETTASAMTWAIYMLCRFPDVQARLRAEVRSRLPSPGAASASASASTSTSTSTGAASPSASASASAAVSSLDIDRMPYLNAVCSEVLRYFGPVPMTLREAAKDTTILGHFVPRGTRIIIAPWAVNKSTALWGPDAGRFDPDRWLADPDADAAGRKAAASGGAASNYAFLTFLHGPRSCIGMAFARAEFACLLAAWVGRFEFELKNKEEMDESKVDIKGGVTARPARGMYVHAKVVDGW